MDKSKPKPTPDTNRELIKLLDRTLQNIISGMADIKLMISHIEDKTKLLVWAEKQKKKVSE